MAHHKRNLNIDDLGRLATFYANMFICKKDGMIRTSVTRKKSPNVYRKLSKIFTPLQKLP